MTNFEYLKTFIVLCEQKSFTETARVLSMTQPGVSHHLKSLEEHFETQLVSRSRSTFEITDAGAQVLDYARKLFENHEALRSKVKLDDPHSGLCRIACPGSYAITLHPKLLAISKKYPDLKIEFIAAPNYAVVEELLENRVDMVFVTREPDEAGVITKVVDTDEFVAIVPTGTKARALQDFEHIGFVSYPGGALVAEKLFHANFPEFKSFENIPIRSSTNQVPGMLEAVAMGLGFSVVPLNVVKRFNDRRITVLELKKPISNPIFQLIKRDRILPARFKFIEEQLFGSKGTKK